MLPHTDELVDRIYEAAVIPDLWPDVLDRLSRFARCFGGTFISVDSSREVRYLVSDSLEQLMAAFIRGGWDKRNVRFERLAPKKHPGFISELDVFTEDEIRHHPYYTEFLRPNGGGWACGTIITSPSGDDLVFNLERAYDDGPIERSVCDGLDRLRPHLARASLISSRLRLQRARAMTETLGLLGLPAAVLRRDGRMLAANAAFEGLRKQLVFGAFDGIALAHRSSDHLLREALTQLNVDGAETGSRSIPIPALDGEPPMIAHLVPVRREANDIFSRASSILLVTPLSAPSAPAEDVLQGLFDLTPAEARIAHGIVRGDTVERLAAAFGLSRETVRTQLKAAMQKTGTSRQAQLVGLLANIERV